MGCRTAYCIGGGCVPTTTDVAAWMSAFGYQYDASDPLDSTYTSFVNNAPNGLSSQAAWKAMCEASMRSRAVLFCNNSAGDVTVANQGNLIGAVGQGTIATLSVVGRIASAAGHVASSLVPIVGDIFSAALGIIQHHAQAVQAQKNALSELCPYATEAIQKADNAVFTGQATPEQAIAFLSSAFATVKSSWASLEHSCNAFCWYNSVLDGILEASQVLYGYAPSPALNNPDAVAGGIIAGQAPEIASIGTYPTNPFGQYAPAPAMNWTPVIIGVLVILGLVAVSGKS